jgi:hypothetical protein
MGTNHKPAIINAPGRRDKGIRDGPRQNKMADAVADSPKP